MSNLDQSVLDILAKPGKDWTSEEKDIIAVLMKQGRRTQLKLERHNIEKQSKIS